MIEEILQRWFEDKEYSDDAARDFANSIVESFPSIWTVGEARSFFRVMDATFKSRDEFFGADDDQLSEYDDE